MIACFMESCFVKSNSGRFWLWKYKRNTTTVKLPWMYWQDIIALCLYKNLRIETVFFCLLIFMKFRCDYNFRTHKFVTLFHWILVRTTHFYWVSLNYSRTFLPAAWQKRLSFKIARLPFYKTGITDVIHLTIIKLNSLWCKYAVSRLKKSRH